MGRRDKIILIGIFLVLSFVWAVIFNLPDNKLHIWFCDVGQGDAILISRGSMQILVDGGPDSRVLECLSNNLPFWDREIEMVVSTHPDADHITGLIDVIERYSVNYFVLNPIVKISENFNIFIKKAIEENATYIFPVKNAKIKAGEVVLRLLWPEEKLADSKKMNESKEKVLGEFIEVKEANEFSIVLRLDYGEFCLFLPGDISSKVEEQLEIGGNCQVLKIPHHGSRYSTGEDFLEKLSPSLAVISVGKNWFGHPTDEVLERLENKNIKILRTDKDGEVEITSDGKSWDLVR